ncbi:MAG: ABC transporter permease [Clostridiales bacterium]|nr:ABC transporter permease [Clostridiales bacterium]MDY4180218.1 ABC transporter permease [Pseudoflavonifractor sp.]
MNKRKGLDKLLISVLAVLISLALGAVLIVAEGHNPLEAYAILFSSVFSNKVNFGEAVIKAVPIAFTGLAVVVAYRCGTFNLGAEGQLLLGAAGCIWFATRFSFLPVPVVIGICLLLGALCGALWGLVPGLLKARYGINEIITTILMNYVGSYLVSWLVNGPLQEQAGANPQSDAIEKFLRLPILVKTTRIHLGVVILILLSAAVYYYLFYTAGGFRMRAVGLNREAAECSGISIRTNVIKAMLFSSAIAGLGGAVEILGVQFRLIDGFGSGYGFDGVAMALIGQLQPFGVLLTSMLFGILRTGANSMQRLAGIPASVIDVIQALIIFFVVSAGSIQLLHGRKRKTAKAAKEES